MRKIIAALFVCMLVPCVCAQSEIQFTLLKSAQKELPQSVVDALDLRLRQVFSRNSAAAANRYNVFVVESEFELSDVLSTEGLMQDVSVVQGELTLTVKNAADGAIYYSMTIPVKGSGTGGEEKAMKAMIGNIKSTDTKFTRFIRLSRQKIQDYYAANCAVILQRAQGLYDQHKYEEATSYLSAVSDALPCYEQASVLLKELADNMTAGSDTVVVERVVAKPVIVAVPVAVPVEEPAKEPVAAPVEDPVKAPASSTDCEITISTNYLDFKVLKCYGNTTQQRITILAEMTNLNTGRNGEEHLGFVSAITDGGTECGSFGIENGAWMRMPPRVKLRREFYVTKVFDKFSSFSYMELRIGDTHVYIRNLPVEWD